MDSSYVCDFRFDLITLKNLNSLIETQPSYQERREYVLRIHWLNGETIFESHRLLTGPNGTPSKISSDKVLQKSNEPLGTGGRTSKKNLSGQENIKTSAREKFINEMPAKSATVSSEPTFGDVDLADSNVIQNIKTKRRFLKGLNSPILGNSLLYSSMTQIHSKIK
ncbi:MAG: hypothetical protein MHMPM18_001426 [Marteilia pararefringens]